MSTESELIVCASDFSEQSASALEWAVGFARREGARIDLVHVVPEPTRDPEHARHRRGALSRRRALHDARERLALAATAAGRAGVTVQPHVLAGPPELRIVEHARLHGARTIVVGATGRPLLERWVLGQRRRADHPFRDLPGHRGAAPPARPALVRAPDGASPAALQALVGLEGAEEGGSELVRFAAGLRRRGPCDVTFLHLYWPTEEYARLGLRGAAKSAGGRIPTS